MLFYRVDLGYYCCGFYAQHGKIIRTAPVMRRWLGEDVATYKKWARKKGGVVTCMGLV